MKLHHLLQKCSFFLIKLAAVQASGGARVKLQRNGFDFLLLIRAVCIFSIRNVEPLAQTWIIYEYR
jgi:hypothetical protein